MKLVGCLVFLGTFGTLCSAKYFPSFIKKCSESDPNFDECVTEQTNILIPKLGPGIAKMHVPPLSPLNFNKITADIGEMHLDLIDGKAYGIENVVVSSVVLDKDAKTLKIVGSTPKFTIKSKYETSGKILILPIEGHGDFEGTLIDVEFTYTAHLENMYMETKERMKMVKADFDYSYKDGKFFLDNLFNGNKKLSEPVLKLINEEHQAISKEFKPVFSSTTEALVGEILKPVISSYCYSDIVLP